MGKARLIEIDDRMPVSVDEEYSLPKTNDFEELWPIIITKALLKLFSYKYLAQSNYEIVGDVSFYNALSGVICEHLNIKEDNNLLFKSIFSNQNKKNYDKYFLCFDMSNKKEESFYQTPFQERSILSKQPPFNVNSKKKFQTNLNLTEADKFLRRNTVTLRKSVDNINLRSLKLLANSLNLNNNNFSSPDYNERKNSKAVNRSSISLAKIKSPYLTNEKNKSKVKINLNEKEEINLITNLPEANGNMNQDQIYSILETFSNSDFNMKRLRPIDFSDLNKKLQEAKVPYKTLSKEEKKNYIANLREIKISQKEEKTKRLEELQSSGLDINYIKLKNETKGITLNFDVDYTNQEIEMAKKCLNNNWKFPPPEYFESTFVAASSKVKSEDNSNSLIEDPNKIQLGNGIHWTKELYSSIINNEIEQYLEQKENIEVKSGTWVNLNEFKTSFKQFIILYNPNSFKEAISVDEIPKNISNDIYEPDIKNSVIYLNSNKIEGNVINTDKLTHALVSFEPLIGEITELQNLQLSLNLELKKISDNSLINKYTLSGFYSSCLLNNLSFQEDYAVIVNGGLFPFGYFSNIFANHKLELMSYIDYEKKFLAKHVYNFNIQHSLLEKNRINVIYRIKVELLKETNIKFCVNYNDKYLKQFLELYESDVYNNKVLMPFNIYKQSLEAGTYYVKNKLIKKFII